MALPPEAQEHFLKHSTFRSIIKDFPEFNKFLTGEIEQIKIGIANAIPGQTIDTLSEKVQGGLGDIIDIYFKLKQEEQFEKTLLGKIFRLFKYKRYDYDRTFLLTSLKRALNNMLVTWHED
jgi:hypothetical protein